MEQIHVASANLYAIGSRSRSLFRFSCLLVSAVGSLAILYLVIFQLIGHVLGDAEENTFFAILLLATGLFCVLIIGLFERRIRHWFAFAMRDSAAGFVDPAGLRYRRFGKWHAVPWRDISRIEYFTADNGRIDIYVFGGQFPIRFAPTDETGRIPSLLDFLKNQAQTANRVFKEHASSAFRSNRDGNRKLTAGALLTFSFLVWLACTRLSQYYSYTRPTQPHETQGRIYRQNDRGHVTYLTAGERNLLRVLELSIPILFLVGVFLYPRRKFWGRQKGSST